MLCASAILLVDLPRQFAHPVMNLTIGEKRECCSHGVPDIPQHTLLLGQSCGKATGDKIELDIVLKQHFEPREDDRKFSG
jgi:hypothetical protein